MATRDDGMSLLIKINKMKCHLSKYGHGYLNTYSLLMNQANENNEERRNKLDRDVEEFINVCNDKMKILESEYKDGTKSEQVIMHRAAAIDAMKTILKDFVNHYNQLRMTRMSRNLEKLKYDKIEIVNGHDTPDEELTLDNIDLNALLNEDEKTPINREEAHSIEDCQEHSISADEAQILAQENLLLYEQLITSDDEIKSISKKVVQLSKLQELFAEKVMEQEIDLNNLHETAIRSSENVREGNELIRDAMMKNASTRVFILFYIVTLGFTILFLDWYNP